MKGKVMIMIMNRFINRRAGCENLQAKLTMFANVGISGPRENVEKLAKENKKKKKTASKLRAWIKRNTSRTSLVKEVDDVALSLLQFSVQSIS